ncbi:unnamed protein product, partial [Effrenium voratum]
MPGALLPAGPGRKRASPFLVCPGAVDTISKRGFKPPEGLLPKGCRANLCQAYGAVAAGRPSETSPSPVLPPESQAAQSAAYEPQAQVQIEEQIVEAWGSVFVPTILYQERVVEAWRFPDPEKVPVSAVPTGEVPKVQETILLKQVPRVEAIRFFPIRLTEFWLELFCGCQSFDMGEWLEVQLPLGFEGRTLPLAMGRSGALLAILALAALARCFVPAEMARAPRDRVARSAGGLINKLRAKSGRAKPELQQAEAALSSALPPGSTAPALRARCHELLKGNPEMLKAVSSASDFRISVMTEEDAQDLADLQAAAIRDAKADAKASDA